MGRITLKRRKDQAWTLTRPTEDSNWCARFSVKGRTTERSTGSRDPDEADAEAARLVASARAGELRTGGRAQRQGAAAALEEVVAEWLLYLETTHAERTREVWSDYAVSHFVPFFGTTEKLTVEGCAEYRRRRLGKVMAATVRHELTALRSLVAYCALPDVGLLPEPIEIAGVPKRVTGKAHPVRRRSAADPLSPSEVAAIIALLPEWGGRRGPKREDLARKRTYKAKLFPIRARFVVGYETGLRPGTLDALSVPEHYEKGSAMLRLTDEADKQRWGRQVPLSKRARKALDAVCPDAGLIFGWHDYRPHLKAAAAKVLKGERAKRFAGSHLRSARITHLAESTQNLPGVQYLVGHKLISTTARYVKPSLRAALSVLGVTPDLEQQPQVSKASQRQRPRRKA
jgi:integrase